MNKTKKHIGIRIFFLALFLSYFADITFFPHRHIINGIAIVHSHYFYGYSSSKQNQPIKHKHSDNAVTLISQTSSWTALVQDAPQIPAIEITHIVDYDITIDAAAEQAIPTHFYLRGPPEKA